MNRPKSLRLCAVAAAAALLSACGGGSDADVPPTTLTGTAAKGIMSNALVEAFAVDTATGDIATTATQTGTTSANGTWSLSLPNAAGKTYLIKVSAKADGSTKQKDEVSGVDSVLPNGFVIRGLSTIAAAGSSGPAAPPALTITPFSEMMVSAAAAGTGKLKAGDIAQAKTDIKTMLGGIDPQAVAITAPNSATATADESQLALMLTSVSRMANDGAAGCTGANLGEKTKCVVEKLASKTQLNSRNLTDATLANALKTAVNTVVGSDATKRSLVASTIDTLSCTSACTSPKASDVVSIDAAKTLFKDVMADYTTLFSQGGVAATATGAANKDAWKFKQAMDPVSKQLDTFVADYDAVVKGVQHYKDYVAGRKSAATATWGRGNVDGKITVQGPDGTRTYTGDLWWPMWRFSLSANEPAGLVCKVFKDSAATQLATTASEAVTVKCEQTVAYDQDITASASDAVTADQQTLYQRVFQLTPPSNSTSTTTSTSPYSYTSTARKLVRVKNMTTGAFANTTSAWETGTTTAHTGTADVQMNGAGEITTTTLSGELPPVPAKGLRTLVDSAGKMTWSVKGAHNFTTTTYKENIVFDGSTTSAFDRSGNLQASLTLNKANVYGVPVVHVDGKDYKPTSTRAANQSGANSLAFDLVWQSPVAKFVGVVSAGERLWDKSGTYSAPAKISFNGALSTLSGSTWTEFIAGELAIAVDATSLAAYDDTLAHATAATATTAVNTYTANESFTGRISATGRPKIEVVMSVDLHPKIKDERPAAFSVSYRTYAAGATTPKHSVTITGTRGGDQAYRGTFSESATGIAWVASENDRTTTVKKGDTVLGTVDADTMKVTFTDGSFMSLATDL